MEERLDAVLEKDQAKVTITIDGSQITADEGTSVLLAAQQNGIYIPNLCNHPDLRPADICDVCVVKVDHLKIVNSCSLTVEDGMEIDTQDVELQVVRKNNLERILAHHPMTCNTCKADGHCELQKVARFMGISYRIDDEKCKGCTLCAKSCPVNAISGEKKQPHVIDSSVSIHCGLCMVKCPKKFSAVQCISSKIPSDFEVPDDLEHFPRKQRKFATDESNPFFDFNHSKCIMCGICVRTCDELQNIKALRYDHSGDISKVTTQDDTPIVDSPCVSCGECMVRCPINAISPKVIPEPAAKVKSVCTYCGVGCGIKLGVTDQQIVCIEGDRDNPVNKGSLCVKGRFGFNFVNHPERLKTPLIRKDGELVEASWDEALDKIAEKLVNSKGEQFAALASARTTNEDNYVLQKFTRTVMGTNNIDHCARL